jgi:hypothetical protein
MEIWENKSEGENHEHAIKKWTEIVDSATEPKRRRRRCVAQAVETSSMR